MMMRHHITILLTLLTLTLAAHGQTAGTVEDGTSPTFLPTMRVGKVMLDGDSVEEWVAWAVAAWARRVRPLQSPTA